MLRSKTIFLVDDDLDDQEIFCTAMKRADDSINCIFANDGIDALEKIDNSADFLPGIIFIDMNMPRMNGQECLARIRQLTRFDDVPIYMYSTSGDPRLVDQNLSLGAQEFIVKPSNIHDLAAVLKNIISKHLNVFLLMLCCWCLVPLGVRCQKKVLPPVSALKKLSVEDLMKIEVTSVSKSAQKLTEVASAIQVLTSEDIRRSPTSLLPEVLRLAPNLQVARSGSHDWSVTARGFNGAPVANSSLSDKLLVMIDGRTVYNPLFAGVYWDVQSVMKDNIDRIEVVSGPGGTLWGANAVNGVINIITKNAKETQGLSVNGAYGTFLRNGLSVNYGSHIDTTLYFRVFGQRWEFSNSIAADGGDANDQWHMARGGFRMDFMPEAKNHFTLQGDLYNGQEDYGDSTLVNGQNILARWTHNFSERSSFGFQLYYDRTFRNIKPSSLTDEINTFDIDLQHRFMIGSKNGITWGGGYRLLSDNTISKNNTFTPAKRTLKLINTFIQDQVTVVPNRLSLTIGTKFLYNDYTGEEWQPSIRLAWTPDNHQTIWAAVSRAVRTPSRFDVDLTSFQLVSHPEFKSERVLAYEAGYRFHPVGNLSMSVAAFYNRYRDLRSFDATGNPAASIVFGNNLKADAWGIEFSGNYIISKRWRIRGGYTFLQKDFRTTSSSVLLNTESLEAVDPKNQAILQSIMDLPYRFEFDLVGRYVDKLAEEPFYNRSIPAYFTIDMGINWRYKFLAVGVSIVNLNREDHREFGTRQIPRSIFGKLSFRF